MDSIQNDVVSRRLAILVCSLPALYFALTAAYALLNFDSYASDTPQLLRYVLAPLSLAAVFLLCGAWMSRRLAVTVGIGGLAVLGGLFLFELLLSIRLLMVMLGMFGMAEEDAQKQSARLRNSLPPAYTLKQLNNELGTTRLADALLGGIPHEPVLLCSRDGQPIVYEADRFGFNNPDSVYRGRIDLVVVGDSFVEGHCLPRGSDLVSQIRTALPGTAGLGMRGSGPMIELAMLGRFASALRPRTVVVAFFEGNDWENLRAGLDMPWLRDALEPGADFGSATPHAATVARAKDIVRRWDGLTADVSDVFERTQFVRNFFALQQTTLQLGLFYPQVAQPQPEYRLVLHRMKQLTNEWGGNLILLYIPRVDRFRGLLRQDFVHDRLRGYVLSAAAGNDIEVVDLTTIFHRQPDPDGLYAPDSHLSERGTAVAAHAVLGAIASRPRPEPGPASKDI